VLSFLLVLVLFPFYWMTITSFKTEDQMRSLDSMFWPSPFVLDNYVQLLTKTEFTAWFGNSAIVAVSSTLARDRPSARSAPTPWPGSGSGAARSCRARY
jgi:multiple sugar transport system permease protein